MENPDDWKGGLLLNGDRLEEYSVSIRAAGEHLLRARCIIKDLESSESLRHELNDALADELCEAMSRYCRTPAARFFNSFLIMEKPFFEATKRRGHKKFANLPWTDAQYHVMVTYCSLAQIVHVNQPSEDTATAMIRCMDACIKKRPDDASIYDMFGKLAHDPWLYARCSGTLGNRNQVGSRGMLWFTLHDCQHLPQYRGHSKREPGWPTSSHEG
jgi:hypothetical protein